MDSAASGFALRIEQPIAAPLEKVYAAFTQAETLARWFAPTEDYTIVVTESDVRVGGRYALEMHHKGGNVHELTGTYRIVEPPHRLAFTFVWTGKPERGDSLVTVTLSPTPTGTLLVLVHEQLPDATMVHAHQNGWGGSLPRLARLLETH